MDLPREPELIAGYTVDDIGKLVSRALKFRTIYADPPWAYEQSPRGAASKHYATMSVKAIEALPVMELCENDAHLHLWAPHSFLEEAHAVMRAWGFCPKSIMVWVKPRLGNGHYWRAASEFLLFGLRGNLPFRDRSIRNWHCVERTGHSSKPELFRKLIEKVSYPPFLELFGRRVVDRGWVVHGNEVPRTLFDDDIAEL